MAKQTINIGASPNDGTGTPLRTSFDYTNQNFTELYTAVGPSGNNIVVPGNATITGDLTARTTGLTVNSSGVGIGTNSQSSFLGNSPKKLVIGDGTQTPALTLYGGSTNVGGLYYADGTVGNQAYRGYIEYDHNTDSFGLGVSGSLAMTLNSTGLGVGLAPANDKLLVSQTIGLVTSTTADVNFRNSGNTTIQRIRYDDSTGTLTIGSALGTAYPVQIGGNTTTRAVTIDASGNLILLPSNTPATLATNGQLTVNATSNTNLRFSYRGSDGVTRVANITLA